MLRDSSVSLLHFYNYIFNLLIWILAFVEDLKNLRAMLCCVTFSGSQHCRFVVALFDIYNLPCVMHWRPSTLKSCCVS